MHKVKHNKTFIVLSIYILLVNNVSMWLAMPMQNKLLKPWKYQTTEKCKFSAGFTKNFLN